MGLIPPWAKELGGYATFNARIETITTKPAFRHAWRNHRCLIPIAGYYEWEQLPGGVKQPYFIARADGQQLYAAQWEPRHPLQEPTEDGSCTVVVQDGVGPAGDVHPRMPVFLDPEQTEVWMTASPDDAMAMLLSAEVPELKLTRVSRSVNNPRNQGGREFLEPVDESEG
ncbi:SOS response-associated peptidase [Luteimonas sp. 3794]|uniref:SOS response-associated peptidase n=1 Tax=Luteimonas sp. 3794 TaxID=2817730 RepID=UPI002867836C|nr:SOS response-associated peptidase [Luteimonas sp. 3794]MDR6992863.1 putative SOS response-associated peptidase YedK [Luteimonas sp. 3794]